MELAANALDVRRDRVVVEDGLCGIHELLPVLDVPRVARQRVDQPELGQRQADRLVLPVNRHALRVDVQVAARDAASLPCGFCIASRRRNRAAMRAIRCGRLMSLVR